VSGRKTDYFGNLLDALNNARTAGSRTPGAVPEALGDLLAQVQAAVEKAVGRPVAPSGQAAPGAISLDALVKVWPSEPDSRLSVVQVANTFGVSLDTAATALKQAETLGLLRNQAGMFLLTEAGREAAARDLG
jgi:hypothetical protein